MTTQPTGPRRSTSAAFSISLSPAELTSSYAPARAGLLPVVDEDLVDQRPGRVHDRRSHVHRIRIVLHPLVAHPHRVPDVQRERGHVLVQLVLDLEVEVLAFGP